MYHPLGRHSTIEFVFGCQFSMFLLEQTILWPYQNYFIPPNNLWKKKAFWLNSGREKAFRFWHLNLVESERKRKGPPTLCKFNVSFHREWRWHELFMQKPVGKLPFTNFSVASPLKRVFTGKPQFSLKFSFVQAKYNIAIQVSLWGQYDSGS